MVFFEINDTSYPSNSNITLDKNVLHTITCASDANPAVNCDIIEPFCMSGESGAEGCSYVANGQDIEYPQYQCKLECKAYNSVGSSKTEIITLLFV